MPDGEIPYTPRKRVEQEICSTMNLHFQEFGFQAGCRGVSNPDFAVN
jgi:hypothetical protein